jgi:hypothetical protein
MSIERKIVVGLVVLVCMLGIVWSKVAFAFPNEPVGYCSHKWGTPVSEMASVLEKKTISIKEIKIDIYEVAKKDECSKDLILFLEGKMASVTTLFICENSLKEAATGLLAVFGPPTRTTNVSAAWQGEIATIEFVPSKRILIIGSTTSMASVEALLEWYAANIKKRSI